MSFTNSYQPISLADLKEKFKTTREFFDNRIVPIDLMQDFGDYIAYLLEDPEKRIYSEPDLRKFFFEEFVGGLCKRIITIKQIDLEYQPLIDKIVMQLCDLFVIEIEKDNSDMADGMRYLFDITSFLHQHVFQADDSVVPLVDKSFIEKLSEEDIEWRKSLIPGSKIDAVKVDMEYSLKGWAKAQVIDVSGDVLHIFFEHDNNSTSRLLYWYSPEIDRYNTKSEGDDWRLNLKPGDFIDGFDTTKVWYQSTIQDTHQRQEERGDVLYIKIGFRIFDPEGIKEDDQGRKFFGWSEGFDEWLPAQSLRIQKFQSFVKSPLDSEGGGAYASSEETIDDQMDRMLFSTGQVYASVRRRCKSNLLVKFLNRFGELGGYQKIVDRISMENNEALGLDTVFYYLDCLAKVTWMFNKVFIVDYLPKLEAAVRKKILNASEQSLRTIKKDRIDGIINCLIGGLQTRTKIFNQREQDKNLFYCDIGCLFLRQSFLGIRIDGTKILSEVCKNANYACFQSSAGMLQSNSQTNEELTFINTVINKLKEQNVLQEIFSKERGHFQLVQRSEELLKLLFTQNLMTKEELELVWGSTKADETTKLELYKVLHEVSARLRKEDIEFVLVQVDLLPPTKVVAEEIELVHELAKRSRSSGQYHGKQAVDFLWKIVTEGSDRTLLNHASLALTDIIKNWDNTHKHKIVSQIIQQLRQNQDGYVLIRMLAKILKEFSGFIIIQRYQNEDPEDIMGAKQQQQELTDQEKEAIESNKKYESRASFIEHLEQTDQLMQIFFQNFIHYMFKAREGMRTKVETEPNADKKTLADKALSGKFIHSDQINERLEFLKFLMSQSQVRLPKEGLRLFWEELVVHAMFPHDSDMFYKWLKEICDAHLQGESIVDLDQLIEFFRENVGADQRTLTGITVEGFNCIQSFFVLVNECAKKLIRLNQGVVMIANQKVQKFTQYSNTTGGEYKSYSFNQNKPGTDDEIDFHVIVVPSELDAIDCLWTIAVEASNLVVNEKARALLIKAYTSVTYRLEKRLSEFEYEFMQKCISSINVQRGIIKARTEVPKDEFERIEKPILAFSSITSSVLRKVLPPEEKRIKKYLSLLKELIRNSEKESTMGIRSHASLFKGEYLPHLQITNSIKTGSAFPQKVELGLYANTTVWELRKLIGERVSRAYASHDGSGAYIQETPCHPASIRIYRHTGCTDIKDQENGKTLAELKFKPNEQLTVYRRTIFASSKVPLFNEDGTDLCDKAKEIFTQWFATYSVEDPALGGRRLMTPATCVDFTRSCTEEPCSEEDPRVVGLFAEFDGDHDGKIELEEFLSFYLACALEKEEVVRQNLHAHNYRYDLKLQPTDGEDENLLQARKAPQEMPRYILANDVFFFDSLFSLLDLDSEISTNTWGVIKSLATQPILYQRVLSLNLSEDFSWDQVFDTSSIYKMLYALQIVESLLEEDRNECAPGGLEPSLRKDWTERFLSIGGFQEILTLFQKSLNMLTQKPVDQLTKFEKNFLEYMLKMIRIFILSAFAANDQSLFEVLNLVKKSSSVVQVEEQETQANQDQEDKQVEDVDNPDKYKTPSKQFKPGILHKLRNEDDQLGEIALTQEAIFGVADKNYEHKAIDNSDQAQGSTQQRKLDNDSERFQGLAQIMKETGLGESVLEKIDFKSLQNEVLEVACLILGKKEITADDVQIMESCLSLWVASLIKSNHLIDDFYQYKRTQEQSGFYGIRNAEDLILTGMYTYKSYRVREEFCNAIACVVGKVKRNVTIPPLVFFIGILQRNFPRDDQYYATRECTQYFDLFIALTDEYIKISQEPNNEEIMSKIDPYEILRETVEKLKRHNSSERKGQLLEDKTMIGYFRLAEKLVVHLTEKDKGRLQEVLEHTNLIHELFYEHLFYTPAISLSKIENKSKTKESRAACYSLFQKVLEVLDPRELADFLEDNLWPLLKDLQRPKKWKYVPSENSRQQGFVGLVNLGCICYMLSMLQQFFMVPQFRYQLLKAEDNSPEDLKEYKGHMIDDNLLRQMQKMYGFLELSEKQAYDPFEFCFAFKDLDGQPTNTAIQKDAQEFLTIFFDRLEEKLKPTTQRHLLESVFGGKVCSQLICQSCGNIRNILEKFYNLSVPVKDRKGMEDSLSKMIEGFIINDFKCESCNQKVDVFKRNLIAETPNVLIVHLERIIFNFDTFQNDKINTRFEFPHTLNLKPYSFREVMVAEQRHVQALDEEHIKHLMTMEESEFIYKLVGVIIHRGTAEHGHYYSLINTKRGSEELDEKKPEWMLTDKDPWKEFNDETVKYFSFNDLKTEAFGGSSSVGNYDDNEMSAYLAASGTANSYGQNAYMLVYERMKKKPLKEVHIYQPLASQQEKTSQSTQDTENPSTDNAALECADTALSRVDDIKEEELLIPYRKVESFVPEWIKSMVQQDNVNFLLDRFIYHESFFDLLKALFKHISSKVLMSQHHYKLDYVPHFTRLKAVTLQIGHKTLFELMTYYFYNKQMSDITSSLQSIMQFCDSHFSLSRNQDSLLLGFIKKAYLEDDCRHFFNIMFDCSDKTPRFYIGKITAFLINKAYSMVEQAENKETPALRELKEATDTLLTKFITSLKTSECMKSWTKFDQYLKLIQEIGTGGNLQVQFLLTKFEIVVELIDFMLGNRSPLAKQRNEKRPVMGPNGFIPAFEPLVSLVCYLARFSLTPAMSQERHLWQMPHNPPPSSLMGYDPMTDTDKPEKYPLSERTRRFIVYSGFLELILREGVDCDELGRLLAHYCYEEPRLSKSLSKVLLNGIGRNDYEKVRSYLDVVTQIALIRDQHQRKRLEWIFGFGSLISHTSNINKSEDEVATKVGVKALHSASDEVYSFRSALTYDSADDALLHLLWRHRVRMESYTVSCLFSLLNLIAQDDAVAEFFAEMPSPSYLYARYTDWIKPYLTAQLLDARKGYAGTFSAQKEELVVKALSLYEKYEEFLERRYGISKPIGIPLQPIDLQESEKVDIIDYEENVRNLIKATEDQQQPKEVRHVREQGTSVLRSVPQPYVIVECVAEKQVMRNDFGNVILTILQLSCLYTTSEPTGSWNLSFPLNLFKPKLFERNQKIQQSREQLMQAQSIQGYFQSSKSTFAKQKDRYQQQNDNEAGETQQHSKVIEDDAKQWELVNNMNVSDQEESEAGYEQDQEDGRYDGLKRQNSGIDQGLEPQAPQEQVSYKIRVLEEGEVLQDSVVNATTNYEEAGPEGQQENQTQNEDQQEQEESRQMTWPEEVNLCEDLLYKIQIENKRDQPVKASLTFREANPDEPCNLVYPKGGMKQMVYSGQTKTFMILHKLVPDQVASTGEIHKLAIELLWKERIRMQGYRELSNQSKYVDPVYPEQTQGCQGNQLDAIEENDEVVNDQDPRINVSDTNINLQSDDFGFTTGTKECPTCTFLNDQSNIICEMCESNLL